MTQCAECVQFNWARYLCSWFLTKYREAQDYNKTFHYSWFLLSIVLVAWELLEDKQFHLIETDLREVAMFAYLWATKDTLRVRETKVFWVLMEASIRVAIN